MNFQRETIPSIDPFVQESWGEQTGDTFIKDIRVLGVSGNTDYFGPRQIREYQPGTTPPNTASSGFGKCSGLVIRDSRTGVYTVSHLDPSADAWHEHMRTGHTDPVRWDAPRDAVLVYGSVSVRQCEIERLMTQGFWGSATLRTINAETGGAHWGMALNRHLGHIAVVRKTPDHSVFRYQAFEPQQTTTK